MKTSDKLTSTYNKIEQVLNRYHPQVATISNEFEGILEEVIELEDNQMVKRIHN